MKVIYPINWTSSKPNEQTIKSIINKLCKNHTSIKRSTLCKSVCSRDIECLHIGNTNRSVLYVGAFHGMEWLTSLLLLKFIDNVAMSIEGNKFLSEVDISSFINKVGLTIIPCINPDGVEISLHGAKAAKGYEGFVKSISKGNTDDWQANAHGVDLNHNFDAGWQEVHKLEIEQGIIGPAKTRYGGICPETEPEVIALENFCKKKDFRHAVAFHSQGKEIYWSFSKNTPQRSKLMAQVLASSSGYLMTEPSESIAVGGGFKDWFIDKFARPGFTIEIGEGKNPLPLSMLDEIYFELEEMMVLCSIM